MVSGFDVLRVKEIERAAFSSRRPAVYDVCTLGQLDIYRSLKHCTCDCEHLAWHNRTTLSCTEDADVAQFFKFTLILQSP